MARQQTRRPAPPAPDAVYRSRLRSLPSPGHHASYLPLIREMICIKQRTQLLEGGIFVAARITGAFRDGERLPASLGLKGLSCSVFHVRSHEISQNLRRRLVFRLGRGRESGL